jgi:integrase
VAALHREIATKPRPMKDRNGQVVMRPELDAEGKPVLKDGRPVMHPVMRHGAPYEANRTLEVVKKMFFLAQVWGFVPEDFRNPAVGIERFKETKRERWITHEELPELAKAIDAENNVYARAAVWLYLFTGCRRSELLGAKWEQVDETRCELFLPTTKAGRAFTVPLSPPAMSILSSLPRIAGNPFIFPSLQPRGERKEPGHLVNIDKAWRRVRKAAGVADVRLHDLRRTVGSWLAMDGASLLVIGKTLNQTSPATTAVYARLSQDPVRAALDKHAKRILAIVKPKRKSKAKVTNLAQWRGSKG